MAFFITIENGGIVKKKRIIMTQNINPEPDDTNVSEKNNKAKHYVDNKKLQRDLSEWLEKTELDPTVIMPDDVAVAIINIANNLSRRYNFSNYTATWRDEMIGDGIEHCLKYIKNYKFRQYSNPLAYITQICFNAFVQRIKKERRETNTKYKMFLEEALDYENEEGEHKVEYDFYRQMSDRVDEYEKTKKNPSKSKLDTTSEPNIMESFHG